jgi:hypothetical protein
MGARARAQAVPQSTITAVPAWIAIRIRGGVITPCNLEVHITGATDCRILCIEHLSSSGETPMGIFSKILAKLGIGKKSEAPVREPSTVGPSGPVAPMGPPAPRPIAVVDVVAQLEERAARNPQKLNWRTSIVDLLKLLDIDSSFAARKELATELGCPPELMGDSAKMNMWLHKTVLAKIAANGGNVPGELLD